MPDFHHCLTWRHLAAPLILAGLAFSQAPPPAPDQPGNHRTRYLNLKPAATVPTRYTGETAAARSFRGPQTRALSTTTGDFDEDGMPDLVSGFSTAAGGAVTVHRGNVSALWNYAPAGSAEPPAFLPDARVFTLPEPADFLAAGDFDADGRWDIVAAHIGSKALYLLKGDGHGGFAEPERIALSGAITAMTSGEINRADGLTDLMLGATTESGSKVLVFEAPTGALRAPPEAFDLPSPATALSVIPMDGAVMNGLAVAAGHDLLLIHGRDRKLTRAKAERESVPAATIHRQSFPFAIRSLAVGNFTSPTQYLAALGDDGQIHFLERSDANQPLGTGGAAFLRASRIRPRPCWRSQPA
jgi:hypothetical protein